MEENIKHFIDNIKKVNKPRQHKIKNSYGVYDGYKFYRKTKPKEPKYVLTESQYFSIIRKINNYLAILISEGNDLVLPCRMGLVEIRKYNANITIRNNKVITNLPIDWDQTLKLWYEDEEALKNKTLIKSNTKEIFKVHYNKSKATYNNKSFYHFSLNRDIKKKIKQNIKNGNIDAFLMGI